MKYILVAFKNRNSVYAFARFLRNNNIQSNIINTPRNISTSCGLSVKVNLSSYKFLQNLIKSKQLYNVLGVYFIETYGTQEKIEKIF